MNIWKSSIRGHKPINEDYVLHTDMGHGKHLLLIADGMGGYANGRSTAELIGMNISVFLESQQLINERIIQVAINKANLILKQRLQDGEEKAGATIGGVFIDNSSAIIFWVGDVKIYYLKDYIVHFENKEHSFISHLIDKKIKVSPEVASRYRHVVTRSVFGDLSNSSAGFHKISKLNDRDIFIIYSDGFKSDNLLNIKLPSEICAKVKSVILKNAIDNDDSSIMIFSI